MQYMYMFVYLTCQFGTQSWSQGGLTWTDFSVFQNVYKQCKQNKTLHRQRENTKYEGICQNNHKMVIKKGTPLQKTQKHIVHEKNNNKRK